MAGPNDIGAIMDSYIPSGDERSSILAKTLVDQNPGAWARSVVEPGHFTSSGFVVSPDGDSVLLILHGKLHRWLQPGGHMEVDDESAEAAARREVLEETGVDDLTSLKTSPVRIDVHEIPARGDEPKHLHFDLGFAFQAGTEEIGPLDEVVDARWVPFDDLDQFNVDDGVRLGALAARDIIEGSASSATSMNRPSSNGAGGTLR